MPSRVDTLMSRLEANGEERAYLMKRLKSSIAIQREWPEAFDSGPVECYWHGSPSRGFTFTIRNAQGGKRNYSQSEAPEFAGEGPRYMNGQVISTNGCNGWTIRDKEGR